MRCERWEKRTDQDILGVKKAVEGEEGDAREFMVPFAPACRYSRKVVGESVSEWSSVTTSVAYSEDLGREENRNDVQTGLMRWESVASVSRAVVEAECVGGGCSIARHVVSQVGFLASNGSAIILVQCRHGVVAFYSAEKGAFTFAVSIHRTCSDRCISLQGCDEECHGREEGRRFVRNYVAPCSVFRNL